VGGRNGGYFALCGGGAAPPPPPCAALLPHPARPSFRRAPSFLEHAGNGWSYTSTEEGIPLRLARVRTAQPVWNIPSSGVGLWRQIERRAAGWSNDGRAVFGYITTFFEAIARLCLEERVLRAHGDEQRAFRAHGRRRAECAVHVRGVMLLSYTAWQTSTGGGRGGRAVGS
jgi:hypothetical protein